MDFRLSLRGLKSRGNLLLHFVEYGAISIIVPGGCHVDACAYPHNDMLNLVLSQNNLQPFARLEIIDKLYIYGVKTTDPLSTSIIAKVMPCCSR